MSLNKYLLTLAVATAMTGCTVVSPGPQEAAVLMDKPIIFGNGGVRQDDVRKPGTLSYSWWTTEKFYVNMAPQLNTVPFDDYSSKDNILLDFDSSIQWRTTDPAKLVALGEGWFSTNIRPQYAEITRAEVKKYDMKEMMSDGVTAAKLDADVLRQLRELVSAQKIPIEIMAINLGRAKPNPNVLTQMNMTAAEQQRKLTMDQSKLAEEARKEQQIAKANADNAYRTNMNLTPQQYVDLQIAGMQLEACRTAKSCTILPPGTPAVAK